MHPDPWTLAAAQNNLNEAAKIMNFLANQAWNLVADNVK